MVQKEERDDYIESLESGDFLRLENCEIIVQLSELILDKLWNFFWWDQ